MVAREDVSGSRFVLRTLEPAGRGKTLAILSARPGVGGADQSTSGLAIKMEENVPTMVPIRKAIAKSLIAPPPKISNPKVASITDPKSMPAV